MYEMFGAVVTGQTVEFQLFFPDASVDPSQYNAGSPEDNGVPHIAELRVVGDFQEQLGQGAWDRNSGPVLQREPHPSGMLYRYTIDTPLPQGFYLYKYFVTFENGTSRWCADPCARYIGQNQNSGFVIGGNRMDVRALQRPSPASDLIIYELMIDDFTAGYRQGKAPVDAVRDKLDYLVDLGINAIEFLPWTAWPGSQFDWGYDPVLFFAVEDRYIEDPAQPQDRIYRLKRLVDEAHQRGLAVIMDGVFNHVNTGPTPDLGFPYHWLYQNPQQCPYTGYFGEWGFGLQDLDYHNRCTLQFIFDVCVFWLDTYQLDGIRFDYARGFFDPSRPEEGVGPLLAGIREHLAAQHRDHVALILEDLTEPRYLAVDHTNRLAASGCWYDPFLQVTDAARTGNTSTQLVRVLDTARDFQPGKGPVLYADNHDHPTIATPVGGRGLWFKTQPAALALFTASGAPLIRNGQEFAQELALPNDGPNRVAPHPLDWALPNDGIGQELIALYRRLAALRADYPALRSPNFYPRDYDEQQRQFNNQGYGVDVDRGILIYHRWGDAPTGGLDRFIVVLNFSPYEQRVDIPFTVNGTWSELLDGGDIQVDQYQLTAQLVPSNWGRIYFNRTPTP
jgi:pullulanase